MAISNRNKGGSSKVGVMARAGRCALVAVILALGVGTAGLAGAHGPKHDEGEKMQIWKNMSQEEKREKMEARLERRLERMTERLDALLDLSDEQEAQVEAILSEAQTDIQNLRGDDDPDKANGLRGHKRHRGEVRSIMQGAADDIEAVLTDEQAAEFAEIRERMRERRGKRGMKGHRHGNGPENE